MKKQNQSITSNSVTYCNENGTANNPTETPKNAWIWFKANHKFHILEKTSKTWKNAKIVTVLLTSSNFIVLYSDTRNINLDLIQKK